MQDVKELLGVEQRLAAETAVQAHKCLRFSQSAVTRSLAYLLLREMDLKKIHALVQGRVLSLSDPLIRIALDMDQDSPGVARSMVGERV